MNANDLRRLANPRFYLVHQNRAQRLRVHVLDNAGAIGVESADDNRAITTDTLHELVAIDRHTHLQTNDPQMADYLRQAWGDADGHLPCRLIHIDSDVPLLED